MAAQQVRNGVDGSRHRSVHDAELTGTALIARKVPVGKLNEMIKISLVFASDGEVDMISIVMRQFGPADKKSSSPSGQQSGCRRTWHIAHAVPHGDGECCTEHWTWHRAQSGSTASSTRSKRFIAGPTAVVLAEWG